MENKGTTNEGTGPVVGAVFIVLGLVGYGWWQLGDGGRRAWLDAVRRAEGYGPVPMDILPQLEWLATNRLHGMEGMAALLLLAALAGVIEGSARREAEALSGSACAPKKTGRVLGLLWTGCLVVYFIRARCRFRTWAPASCWLVCSPAAAYKLARGVRRAH